VAKFKDEWLAKTLEQLIGDDKLEEIRGSDNVSDSLWQTVVDNNATTDEQLLGALATRFRVKLADFSLATRSARDLVPEQVARRYHILPIDSSDSHLEIATANPFDLDCEKTLAFATGREVRVLLASPAAIRDKIDELYRPENVLDKLLEGMESDTDITTLETEEDDDVDDAMVSEAEASERPVVRMVDLIISEGILARASDLHIEPEEGGVSVRYRIDGVLRQVMKIPRAAGLPLISRLKIIANLDIADRLRPQDGRARVAVNKKPVDLRISTLPVSQGEKVVIRILDASRTVLALESLGLAKTESSAIEDLLEHRDGVILVTGPTGSGKTTTLYSAIRFVQDEGVNIVTVEDPVEYRLSGIVQVQVHEKAGLTFSAALRSILRQDPDVVLVGEIRDNETAQIAIQASLTGHLVLSTLHTNDAASAVTRLSDLGVENFKIATALRGIVAQRLMRTLCSTCREELNDPVSATLQKWIPEGTQLHRAVGCPDCAMTGYRGRFSIMEVLKVTKEIERIISDGGTANRIAEAAERGGMKTLWDSGLAHVLNGESTMDELLRVVDMPQEEIPDAAADEAPVAVATAPAPVVEAPARRVTDEFQLLGSLEPVDGDGTVASAGIRVLLVDDEDQLRRVMKDLLERVGYDVVEASDGADAIQQVDQHTPDILVLDLNLPGLDGYGVISHLRSRPATEKIPIIVLTAKGDEDNEVRVFELGADDFLSKPFRARALSARIQAVLARSRG